MTADPLTPYQTDHLFLLVGTNPLPNWVAVRLLVNPDGVVWLLYSDGAGKEPSTQATAVRLKAALGATNSSLTIWLEPIASSDNIKIADRVKEIFGREKTAPTSSQRVGLNYTGGTKPMSIHVHRTLETMLAKKEFQYPVFSYLDPRHLAMRFDGRETQRSEAIAILKDPAIRRRIEIELDHLADLHGYKRQQPQNDERWAPFDTPGLTAVSEAIAKLHTSADGISAWNEWAYKKHCNDLPDAAVLPTIRAALDNLCGGAGSATNENVATKLRPNAKKSPTLSSCQNWFHGIWLELYSLACLRQAAQEASVSLASSETSPHYKAEQVEDDFELDVAATIGYQLFAISCDATDDKNKAKEHFMEIFVRARQLGGDEARVGLVCAYDDAPRLQKEIEREWDAAGKIKVFDRNHLKDLTSAFKNWLLTANL